jgi:zinc transport system substrate-binding protein
MSPRLPGLAAVALAVAVVSGCGATGGPAGDAGKDGRLEVVAGFYPLQYAVAQIGGDRVDVSNLTKPGAEPHDLELSPRQVGRVALSDLVVYLSGFQPAVDQAVEREARGHSFDVAPAAHLDLTASDEHESPEEPQDLARGHEDEDHTGHDHGPRDPHFWLDPVRYADVGDAIARELSAKDPAGAAAYTAGAQRFRAAMTTLDGEFRSGLATCANRDLVTSHAAFGYLAERYDLHQESITGLDPESEPDPASLARIVTHVRETGVTTIYSEVLVSPDVARTIARETGTRVAVLDPLEGITSESAGDDYPSVMRSNLATLRTGQECT